jgi:hypothetical protein
MSRPGLKHWNSDIRIKQETVLLKKIVSVHRFRVHRNSEPVNAYDVALIFSQDKV